MLCFSRVPQPLLGSLRPSRTVSWESRLGQLWLPKVTQLISAWAALGRVGAPSLSFRVLWGPWGSPCLEGLDRTPLDPGSSGEMQGLGFDRGSGEAGLPTQALPRPRSTRSTWGSGVLEPEAPKTLPSGPVSEPEPFWEGHFLGMGA